MCYFVFLLNKCVGGIYWGKFPIFFLGGEGEYTWYMMIHDDDDDDWVRVLLNLVLVCVVRFLASF